jgi:hypothetical protein
VTVYVTVHVTVYVHDALNGLNCHVWLEL